MGTVAAQEETPRDHLRPRRVQRLEEYEFRCWRISIQVDKDLLTQVIYSIYGCDLCYSTKHRLCIFQKSCGLS